jgi:hypothetical protein
MVEPSGALHLPADWILECSRPVIFESGLQDEEFLYWVGATAFVCKWYGKYYVLTAGHALKGVSDDHVLIFPHDDAERSIGFSVIWRPTGPRDQDYTDLAIFEVAETDENQLWMGRVPAPELAGGPRFRFEEGDQLVISGYPNDKRVVDYDRRKIPQQRYRITGRYLPESYAEHLHVMKLDTIADLKSFDGFSGSPVFIIRGTRMVFAGLAIRGAQDTSKSDLVHFIDTGVIQTALTMAQTGHLPVRAAPE